MTKAKNKKKDEVSVRMRKDEKKNNKNNETLEIGTVTKGMDLRDFFPHFGSYISHTLVHNFSISVALNLLFSSASRLVLSRITFKWIQ